jgi:hypothetical protein
VATEVTYIVDPDGSGDYPSLQAFAADAKDLVTADQTVVVKCRSQKGDPDTEQVTFDSSWTTDETHTITIVPEDDVSSHKGVWSDHCYRLQVGPHFAYAIKIEDVSYIKIRGLQIMGAGSEVDTWDSVIDVVGTASTGCAGIEVSECLIRPGQSTTYYDEPAQADIPDKSFHLLSVRNQNAAAIVEVKVFNNLFLATTLVGAIDTLPCLISRPVIGVSAGKDSDATKTRVYVDNNTFDKNATSIYSYGAAVVEARNNLFNRGRGPLEDLDGTISSTTSTHNATTRGVLSKSGNGTRIAQAFKFRNQAIEDFRLDTDDKGATNVGTDYDNLPTGLLSSHDPFNVPEAPVDVSLGSRPPACEGVEPDPVEGCTDPAALNYNGKATVDDGSCQYPKPACPADNLWMISAKFGPGVCDTDQTTTGDKRFQNQEVPYDVDDNGIIDTADATAIVSWVNDKGSDLPLERAVCDPFVDVNGDNTVAPNDVNNINTLLSAHGPIRVKDIRVADATKLKSNNAGTQFTNDYKATAELWAKLKGDDPTKGETTGFDPYSSDAGSASVLDTFRNPVSFVVEKDPALTDVDPDEEVKGYIYWITVDRPPHNEIYDDGSSQNAKVHPDDYHGKIWRAKLDGSSAEILYDELVNPCDLTLDSKGHLYWTERIRTNEDAGVGHTSQAGFGLYTGFIMQGRRSQEANYSYIDKEIFVVCPALTWEPVFEGSNWPVNGWPLATSYGVIEDSDISKRHRSDGMPLDVNNDGVLSSQDITDLTAGVGSPPSDPKPEAFFELSGDDFVSALDATVLTTYLDDVISASTETISRGSIGFGSYPAGIDYDPVTEKLYWCDAEKRAIYSARVLGGKHSTQKVEKVAKFTAGRHSNRVDDPIIRNPSTKVPVGYGPCPYGLVVDGDNHHIYFSEGVIIIPPQGSSPGDSDYHDHDALARTHFSIQRVNVDGTGKKTIDDNIASAPLSLALDRKRGHLYYPHASGLGRYVEDASQIANADYEYWEGRETVFDGEVITGFGQSYDVDATHCRDIVMDGELIDNNRPLTPPFLTISGSASLTSMDAFELIKTKNCCGSRMFTEDSVLVPGMLRCKTSSNNIRLNSTIGLSFNPKIPPKAKIVSAKLKLQFYQTHSGGYWDDYRPSSSNIRIKFYGDLDFIPPNAHIDKFPYMPWWDNNHLVDMRTPTTAAVAWTQNNLPSVKSKFLSLKLGSNNIEEDAPMVSSPELNTVIQELVDAPNYTKWKTISLMLASNPGVGTGEQLCKFIDPCPETLFWVNRVPVLEITYKEATVEDVPSSGVVRVTVTADGASDKLLWDTKSQRVEYLGVDDQWFLGGGEVLPCDDTVGTSSSESSVIVVDESAEVDAQAYYDTHVGDDHGSHSHGAKCSGRKCPRWETMANAVAKLSEGPQTVTFTYSFMIAGTVTEDSTKDTVTIRDYYDGGTYHGVVFPNIAGGPTLADFKSEIALAFAEWKAVIESIFSTTNGYDNNLTVNFTNLGDETGNTYPSSATYIGDVDGKGKGAYTLPGSENLGDIRIGMHAIASGGVYSAYNVIAHAGRLDFEEAIEDHQHTGIKVLGEVGNFAGDIHFDQFEVWRKEGETRAGSLSIKYVAVHEIGHSLGLYPDAYDGEDEEEFGNTGHDIKNGFNNIMNAEASLNNFSAFFPTGLSNAGIMTASNGLTEVFRAVYGAPPTQSNALKGCTDPDATNFDPDAKLDDGTCQYADIIKGCTDSSADNYDKDATCDDGSCEYPDPDPSDIPGCMDPTALNYDATATVPDGSCNYDDEVVGCMDPDSDNFNPNATKTAKPNIFWVEYSEPVSTGNVGKINLTAGTNSYILDGASDGIDQPVDVAYEIDEDSNNNFIYLTEENSGAGRVYQSRDDGTFLKVIVDKTDLGLGTFYPQGIAFNKKTDEIFFIAGNTATGAIYKANKDGSSPTAIVSSVDNGQGITLDLVNNKVYWAEGGSSGVIKKADLDGSNVTTVQTAGEQIFGVALYHHNGIKQSPTHLYYTTDTQLRRGAINGNLLIDQQFRGLITGQRHIVVDQFGRRVYWAGRTAQFSSAYGNGFDKNTYKVLSQAASVTADDGTVSIPSLATEKIDIELSVSNANQIKGIGLDPSVTCTYSPQLECLDIGFHENPHNEDAYEISGAWTNPNNRFDVNNDGVVNSADVDLIADKIEENTDAGNDSLLPLPKPGSEPFFDVSGDGHVSAIDMLKVIRYISKYGKDGEVKYVGLDEDCNDFMETKDGVIFGCTDPAATNFNPNATKSDGSCKYTPPQDVLGCTDPKAINFNPLATKNDGSCVYKDPDDPCPTDAVDNIKNGNFSDGLKHWNLSGDTGLGLPTWNETSEQAVLVYRSVISQTLDNLTPETLIKVFFEYVSDFADDQVAYLEATLRDSAGTKLASVKEWEFKKHSVKATVPADGKIVVEFLTPTFPNDCANPPQVHIDNVSACTVPLVKGCTDPLANNYNPFANIDDGSCEYDPTSAVCDIDMVRVDEHAVINGVTGFPKQDISTFQSKLSLSTLSQLVDPTTKVREMLWKVPGGQDGVWSTEPDKGLRQVLPEKDKGDKAFITYDFGTPHEGDNIPQLTIPYKGSTLRMTYTLVEFLNGGLKSALTAEIIAKFADGTTSILASSTVTIADDYELNFTIPEGVISQLQIKFSTTNESAIKKLTTTIDDIDVHICEEKVPDPSEQGCTDPNACNFNPDAVFDDGSCEYAAEGSCGEIIESPWGRAQIAVDQTQGGEKYPFVDPTENLDQLIADLYLAFLDDSGTYVPPFKIDWLSGFGCISTDDVDACTVSPTEYNLQISDSNDNIVFLSTEAEKFTQEDWNNYYRVLEWTHSSGEILRIVIFTAWSDSDERPVMQWKTYFEPSNSDLDPRAHVRVPRRINKISVVNPFIDDKVASEELIVFEQNLDGGNNGNIILKSGFNLETAIDNPDLVDGGKFISALNFDVESGAGMGKFDNCDELVAEVFRINGEAPNEKGQFLLDAAACYRLERAPQANKLIPASGLTFNPAKVAGSISEAGVDRVHGIIHSRKKTNVLYAHNDGTDTGRFFAVAPLGTHLATYVVQYGSTHPDAGQSVENTDFRDIAIGDGNLFLADVGDRTLKRDGLAKPKPVIYRVPEPDDFTNTTLTADKVFEVDFSDNKQHDVASVAFDPVDGDLYLFTKETSAAALHHTFVYKISSDEMLKSEASGVITVIAKKDATIGPNNPGGVWINAAGVSAVDISSDGRIIMIRDTAEYNVGNSTYEHHAKFWVRDIGESIADALAKEPKDAQLPTVNDEPHGTGLAIDPDSPCYQYYTIGEGLTPTIYQFDCSSTDTNAIVITPGTVQIFNDCGPCCECQDFINVYEGIRKLVEKYNELGKRAEAVRDLFQANKQRWETSKTCREGQNLRITSHAVPVCRAALAFGICNNSDEKIEDVTLTIDFTGSARAGHILANTTVRNGNEGPTPSDRTTVYELDGAWPVYTAHFDCISPGRMGSITTMMKFPDCNEGDTIKVKLTSNQGSTFQAQQHQFNLEENIDVIEESEDCPDDEATEDPPANI